MDGTKEPQYIQESLEDRIGFIKRMGLKVTAARKGYAKLSAPLEGNQNHIGIMYAGALFSLAEFIGGVFCWASFDQIRFYPIVKDMRIKYVKPVKTDAYVEIFIAKEEIERIEKEAETNGKSDFRIETQIKDASGEMVAFSTGVYQLRTNKFDC
ncbi:MAG: PaaI family thioesterase [Proteobacteria bacterium]|nr:PaaI family thioesterase [Pseudomonadota bacterium]